jgi:membrane fusion protein (multidrug efflux system)
MRQRHAISALTLLLGVVIFIGGCGAGADSPSAEDERIPVLTASAVRADLRRSRTYSGTVEGIRQATVYARLAETIERIHVSEGDRVKVGATIATFDESGPGSSLRQLRAVAEEARRKAEKYERLFEQGAVSELERDAVQTAYDVARADYDAAHDRAALKSPIAGVVTEVYAREGRQTNIGEPVALIAAFDTIRVLVDISVYESEDLAEGQLVLIRSELDTALTATGWVDEISVSADAITRMVSVDILAGNRSHTFMPGTFVGTEIELQERSQVVSAPREALVYREGGLGAFVVRDQTAHYTPVVAGIESGDRVEIVSGLSVGDELVILGQNNLQEGTKVEPMREDAEGTTETAAP